MSEVTVACDELATMAQVYDPDKRVPVLIPLKDFGAGDPPLIQGTEVTVAAGKHWDGKPSTKQGSATGRIKRVLVEVEVDLATFKAGQHEGQARLT